MQDLGRENLYKNGADNRDYGKKHDRRACGIRSLVLSPLTDMLPYDDYAFNEAGEAQCTAPLAKISSRFNTLLLTYRVKF